MAARIPASALSSPTAPAVLCVGDQRLRPPGTPGQGGWWFVVLDLTEGLAVVASELSADSASVPPAVAGMLGNPSYFLFCLAQGLGAKSLPEGALLDFLRGAGAGTQLAALRQSAEQLGVEGFPAISYALGATLNDQDLPGFEEASLWHGSVLNMHFVALEVGGRTIYAPVQMGTQNSLNMVRAVQSAGMAPSTVLGS